LPSIERELQPLPALFAIRIGVDAVAEAGFAQPQQSVVDGSERQVCDLAGWQIRPRPGAQQQGAIDRMAYAPTLP
jgi:hypothetical protein